MAQTLLAALIGTETNRPISAFAYERVEELIKKGVPSLSAFDTAARETALAAFKSSITNIPMTDDEIMNMIENVKVENPIEDFGTTGLFNTTSLDAYFEKVKISDDGRGFLQNVIKSKIPSNTTTEIEDVDAFIDGSSLSNMAAELNTFVEQAPQGEGGVGTGEVAPAKETVAEQTPQQAIAEATAKQQTAKEELAGTLEGRLATLREQTAQSIDKLEKDLSGQPEELRNILLERLEGDIPGTIQSLRETEAAGGLGEGFFGQALAEELGTRRGDIESQVAERQLGIQTGVAQQRFALEQGLSQVQAGDVERVSELGFGISQQGAMAQQQFDVNFYLNQLGFNQQMQAMKTQFQNQRSMVGQQQQFAGQQASLDRQLQQSLFSQQLAAQQKAQKDAQSSARRGAVSQLGLTALGGLGGFGLASAFGGGLTGGQGALIGAGALGGNPSLTSLGAGSALGIF